MSIRTVMCVFSVGGWDQDIKSACEFCEARGAHMNAVVLCVSIPAVATFEARARMRRIHLACKP